MNIIKLWLFSFLESYKMASAAVIIPDSSQDKSSRFYLMTWFNNLLKTDFKDLQQMGSGDSSVWAELMQFFLMPDSPRFKHTDQHQALKTCVLLLHSCVYPSQLVMSSRLWCLLSPPRYKMHLYWHSTFWTVYVCVCVIPQVYLTVRSWTWLFLVLLTWTR